MRSRPASFVALARALYCNDRLTPAQEASAQARGVIQSAIELRLWETYGSKSDYLSAPAVEVARTRLLLEARGLAEQDLMERAQKPGGGAGAPSSSAYGHQGAPQRTHVARVTTANSAVPDTTTDGRTPRRSSAYGSTTTASAGAADGDDDGWDA